MSVNKTSVSSRKVIHIAVAALNKTASGHALTSLVYNYFLPLTLFGQYRTLTLREYDGKLKVNKVYSTSVFIKQQYLIICTYT